MTLSHSEKIERIIAAFQNEEPPFEVDRDKGIFEFEGQVGISAHNIAVGEKLTYNFVKNLTNRLFDRRQLNMPTNVG